MAEPIIVVDTSEISEGKLEEVETLLKELAEFVAANEPRVIAYNTYIDDDGRRMTVLQVHPDAASMELHLEIAEPIFRKFAGLLRLQSMNVYGAPSEELLSRLRAKAQLLGTATLKVHDLHAGLSRIAAG